MAPVSKPDAQRPSRAWEALTPPLSEWILDAISSMNFTKMTPVQSSTIPLFMGNKDVVVEAVTGSGKTLAFLIPVIERLLRLESPIKKHHVGAIIISPTRELATQIHSVLLSLLAFHAPSAASLQAREEDETGKVATTAPQVFPSSTLKVVPQLLLGGSTTPAQDLSSFLKNSPNILIGTPGRLLELVSSQHVHCPQSSFEVLVLDEADRLLDLGFKDDLQRILSRLPKQRRTGLFSASVSEAVDQLIRVGLRNPVRINVRVKSTGKNSDGSAVDKRTPASLQMSYLVTPPTHKIPSIVSIMDTLSPPPQKTILYVATCYTVDYFQHILPALLPSQTIIPLHGKHPDKVRRKNFSRFVDSVSPTLLLTTDVAARGLDIPSVDLVLQLDPPSDPKTFIHRCGRAGRAGRKGLALTFITPGREEDYIEFLRVRQTPVSPYSAQNMSVTQNDASTTTDKIREILKADRAIHDKAQRGFVSWVRAYSKHTASSIFRVADLDWEELGKSWGLLRLPKMPELKKWEGDKSLGVSMDWKEYAYKDKEREKQRRSELENPVKRDPKVAQGKKRKGKEEAWSEKKEQKATREERREKKKAKREHERKEKLNPEERQKEAELRDMIAKVRQKVKVIKNDDEEEFEGFDD